MNLLLNIVLDLRRNVWRGPDDVLLVFELVFEIDKVIEIVHKRESFFESTFFLYFLNVCKGWRHDGYQHVHEDYYEE